MSVGNIEITSLCHSFGDGHQRLEVLRNIDLSIYAGQFIALLGTSGCGKTTLLDILSGLTEVQSGQVKLSGENPAAGRQDVARMFARDALMPWLTAEENVSFALATRVKDRAERKNLIFKLLNDVGLEGFQNKYPSELSQGMRQRVALARTFSIVDRFLLLDEPFGALDAITKVTLQSLLTRLWVEMGNTTVVLVTHDISESVALADRIIVMSSRPGVILADVEVPLPRPRDLTVLRETAEYHALVAQLWGKLQN